MKRILTLALSAALVLGATFAVQAQMHGHGFHGKAAMADHDAYLTQTLNLTADQQAAMKQLHQDLQAKAQPLIDQHHQQMAEIHTMLGGTPDATEIGQKLITAHATGLQLQTLHEDYAAKFDALLTADQRTKFQQIRQNHRTHEPANVNGSPESF
ncbi:MAG TPA: Spy/CpxP family protein refolding chaperone [Thermoanaerobaculia bacterium]|jgi:Spy/CpxP family protein refolding chaperone